MYRAGNSKGMLKVFRDANFVADMRTRWPTSDVVAVYADSAVARSSQLQWSVALSTEAEFIAASKGAKELLWLKCLLGALGGNM